MSRNSLAVSGGGGRSLTGAGAHDVPAGVDPPVHRAAPGPVPQAGPAGRSPGWCGDRRRPPGPPRALDPADRVLPVAVYRRTNLTLRRLGPLVGIAPSGVHRVLDTLGP